MSWIVDGIDIVNDDRVRREGFDEWHLAGRDGVYVATRSGSGAPWRVVDPAGVRIPELDGHTDIGVVIVETLGANQ